MTTSDEIDTGAPSRALFVRVGRALFGPSWQHAMAEALDVSPRTVRYWIAGRPIPFGVWADVDRVLKQHVAKLNDLRSHIPV